MDRYNPIMEAEYDKVNTEKAGVLGEEQTAINDLAGMSGIKQPN